MIDGRLDYEKRRYLAIKEKLKAEDPAIDERTLADTVDGLTDFTDVLTAIMRAAIADEAMVDALKALIAGWAERLNRHETRAEKRRAIVRDAMLDAGLNKLTMPDFTASLRNGQPHVVITDEKAIPQAFIEMRPHIRKRELLDALKDGAPIAGAELSNPGVTLSVRVR
jgi:Gp157 protein